MIVMIGKKAYQMNYDMMKKALMVASEAVPLGIYCLKKGGVVDLVNIKAASKTDLKEKRRQYRKAGYQVYCNGL